MAEILQFPHTCKSFDPEMLSNLGAAYDLACANACSVDHPQVVCEVMAKRIIAAAKKGERDTERLYKVASRGFVLASGAPPIEH